MNMKEYKRLGDIATYINGYAFKPEDRGSIGLPIIRIQDLTGNGYDLGYYEGEYPPKIEINNGDILISWSASLGVYIWNQGKALLNQHIFKVVFDKVEIDKNYFVYAVKHKLQEMVSKTHGATMKHIIKKDFDNTLIPFPTLDKQIEIANILGKVEKLIDDRNDELLYLDNLIKARFVEMFGDLANPKCEWEKFPLVKMCKSSDDIKCGPFGTQLSKDEYHSTGIMVWEIPQINSSFKTKPTKFLTNEKAKELQAYSIIPGDIAMSRKGNVGKCALFPENYPNGIIHSDVLRIRVDQEKVNPCFMMHQFHYSRAILNQIDLVSHGAIMAGINVTKLKNIIVHLPPKNIQDDFSSFVSQIDKSKVVYLKAARKYHKQSKVVEMKMSQC